MVPFHLSLVLLSFSKKGGYYDVCTNCVLSSKVEKSLDIITVGYHCMINTQLLQIVSLDLWISYR